ncbi:hypothetical protein QUA41_30605 [Microcoleus sp. Pol11C1]|uniref:hypothetical protein n=1 Tax=unclassified Microcoleus TaxID=2642155 RepID=UPI002FD116FC
MDLTFAEVLAALVPDAIFVDGSKGVCIDVSKVSGESSNLNLLSNIGVVEFTYKLLDACNKAQITKNSNLPTGSKLNAFSNPSWSTPTNVGTVIGTHQVRAQFTVSTAVATAPLV